jgi:hypothetical protein
MNEKQIKTLVEEIVRETVVGMSKNYMFKEQVMQRVQQGILVSADNISTQGDYVTVIDDEIEKVRSDMDLTYDAVARSLKGIPFEIFLQAFSAQRS